MEDLTRNADHAMYTAKHMRLQAAEEAHGFAIITADELESALRQDQFRLAYQPQFSSTGRLTGMEALIRLEDPVLGLVTPDAFISVAERNSVICEIGKWTLRTVLRDAVRWRLHSGEMISVAVNVSVRQLEQFGYAESVLECLKEFGFPASRLEIELIERSLMFSGDKVTYQLELLRKAGVRIALDDFGTGQSCLSLLHRLPVDTIKLDRSFIQAMDDEPRVLPIIQAIVTMAQSLREAGGGGGNRAYRPGADAAQDGQDGLPGAFAGTSCACRSGGQCDPYLALWHSDAEGISGR